MVQSPMSKESSSNNFCITHSEVFGSIVLLWKHKLPHAALRPRPPWRVLDLKLEVAILLLDNESVCPAVVRNLMDLA